MVTPPDLARRPLGPGAPEVTASGFGAMPLSIRGRPDTRQAIRVLHAVFDAGVTLVDTADAYCLDDGDVGHNERLIAQALGSWSGAEDSIVVATKGGLTRPGGRWERDARPERLKAACDRSLLALGSETLALYQLHAPDARVPWAESVGALADLRQAGKVRWVGLSNVTVAQIEEARRIVPITTVQNRLSPFFREAVATGVVRYCDREGIGFLAYSPVGGGRLNHRLPDHPVARAIGQRHGVSAHAAVLAWVRAQGSSVIPIPGARSVPHALDSLGALLVVLSPDDVRALNEVSFSTA